MSTVTFPIIDPASAIERAFAIEAGVEYNAGEYHNHGTYLRPHCTPRSARLCSEILMGCSAPTLGGGGSPRGHSAAVCSHGVHIALLAYVPIGADFALGMMDDYFANGGDGFIVNVLA